MTNNFVMLRHGAPSHTEKAAAMRVHTAHEALTELQKLKRDGQSVSDDLRDDLVVVLENLPQALYPSIENWERYPGSIPSEMAARLERLIESHRKQARKEGRTLPSAPT